MKKIPITKEQKARVLKWVEALESGKYRQTEGTLRDRSGAYCCLGVACNVLKEEVGGKWVTREYRFDPEFVIPKAKEPLSVVLNPKMRKLLGLSTAFENKLTNLNDETTDSGRHVYSFKKIAAIIRERYGLKKGPKK